MFISNRQKSSLDWTRYWNLDEINEWMNLMMVDYPGIVSTFSIGTSYEGREIRGMRINTDVTVRKKSIFFESTIHANEWITTSTTTFIINELLTSPDENVKFLVNRYDWYFVPVLNVDGFAYTWSTDRLWRKTRRPSSNNLLCHGADPNRNWDLFFGEFGASSNPCSSSYAGDFAFSEPEMKQLSEFVPKLRDLVGYFSFHSYGQLLMLPFAYTLSHEANYDTLFEIGVNAVEAIKATHRRDYRLGTVSSFFSEIQMRVCAVVMSDE
jgi:carboxypeptidase A1